MPSGRATRAVLKFFEKPWGEDYLACFISTWTLIILISATWNTYRNHEGTIERARLEAKTISQHNLAYRRWNTLQGGIYARVSETNKPNPFLSVSDRDITTTAGLKLTLIGPFQMSRQAYELLGKKHPSAAFNRTVSLMPLNPANLPDQWERKGLTAFEAGVDEVSEITEISGKPYMRLMKPYPVDNGCLKCHGHQGYQVGDIRGGLSISVPMEPYYQTEASTRRIIFLTHLSIWLLGSGAFVLFSRGLKSHKKTISESERKFRIVSEFAYDFEFWTRENGDTMFISPSCERVTGYGREEFAANPELLHDIIHPDDRAAYRSHLPDYRSPAHEDLEYRILTKGGQLRWISHTCSPIFVEGRFLGRRGSHRDITDRKRLEEQLMQVQKLDAVGRLAGGVAHDFSNILSAILGYSELALMKLPEGHPARRNIKFIYEAGERAADLTHQLLAFSRKQMLQMRVVNLNRVVENVGTVLQRVIGEDVTVALNTRRPVRNIMADPGQLEQILLNLAVNARDAMPSGGVLTVETSDVVFGEEEELSLEGMKPGSYVMLSVADSGKGMSREVLEKIFEPFFTTKEQGKGTGLGLATVYGIVKQHNGYIYVQSEPEKGSAFSIYFPSTTEAAEETPPVERPAHMPCGTERILVVDDEPSIRTLVADMLRPLGYEVMEASSGGEALAMGRAAPGCIDLLITDVVMPGMNGHALAQAFRSEHPKTMVVFMSGYAKDTRGDFHLNAPGTAFIQKPLTPGGLADKVREMLDRDVQDGPQSHLGLS
jgi:PAS domain S-box-containing protein